MGSVSTDVETGPGAQADRPTGLAQRAIGTAGSTVLSLASTAPTYSLAVTVGLLASLVGDWSPIILIAAAVPIIVVVLCFGELNTAEPDCGTCYAWVSRAFGPRVGQFAGWLSIAACVLVMASLVQVAAVYAFTVVGADDLANSTAAQAMLGLVLLGCMTYLAHRGISVAARVQVTLFALEALALCAFMAKALTAEPLPSAGPAATLNVSAVASAFLVAVFLYWGWDSSFSVNEESTDPARTPVRSAVFAMTGLVVMYAGFTWTVGTYAGAARLAEIGEDDLFAAFAGELMGSAAGRVLAGMVLLSALASAQTTILPSARSVFSMSRRGHLPGGLARVSTTGSPSIATWVVAGFSALVYLLLVNGSEDMLADAVAATAVLVAAYYALTCAAVPFFFGRSSATARPVRRIVLPTLAVATFGVVLVMSLRESSTITVVTVAITVGLGIAYPLVHSAHPRPTMEESRHD